MSILHPFLLVCESTFQTPEADGSWRFLLEELDGTPFLEASETEPGDLNRLSLLAVVRGLEALPGPADVTMLTTSRYVIRSLSENLPRWRESRYCWEHFGQLLPITNADLWQRVDRALEIHNVSACCVAPVARQPVARPATAPGVTMPLAQRGGRTESLGSASDSLRRWLIAQCGRITGNGVPARNVVAVA